MKVLVVDDDLTNRLVLKAMLEKDGHEVLLAEHGQQGVEVFEQEHPDMVLMDVMMPVMDGYEATRLIKERCSEIFTPVIFITAVTEDAALADCIDCGGDDFITKPFNRIILRAKIAALERIRELYATIFEQKSELGLHNERILREQEFAEKIYDSIVYQGNSPLRCISSINNPAEMFSGDVMLTANTPSGSLNVLVGDVTGHGLSAAICVMPVAEIFYSMSSKGFALPDILAEINYRLKKLLPTGMFLAAALVQVDSECRLLRVWNGGLPDIYIYGNNDEEVKKIPPAHLPLGIVSGEEFDSQVDVFRINPGDRVMLYTDGIIEATNSSNGMFTQERLERVVQHNKGSSHMIERLEEDLRAFCGDSKSMDDVTVLELNCDPELMQEKQDIEQMSQYHLSKTWNVTLELQADALRTTDPVPLLIQLITGIQGVNEHKSSLFTILSELYNNAFDHGVLDMDSALKSTPDGFMEYYMEREKRITGLQEGLITITVANNPSEEGGCLTMRIEDSGKGFTYQNREGEQSEGLDGNVGNSGRGIPLIHTLCDYVTYKGKGNEVEASYSWR